MGVGVSPPGALLELAPLVRLVAEIVLSALPSQFNPAQLKALSDYTTRLATYLPTSNDGVRIISNNIKELPQPALDPKRTKRVRDDYVAIRERVRPLQDGLRIILLDRRATPAGLVQPPVLLLIGGVHSLFVSLEQSYSSQLDAMASGVAGAVRGLTGGERRSACLTFIRFIRCMAVRLLETRNPKVTAQMAENIHQLLVEVRGIVARSGGDVKKVAENLKNLMILVKDTVPQRVEPDITDEEEDTIYDYAIEVFRSTIGRAPPPSLSYQRQDVIKHLELLAQEANNIKTAWRTIKAPPSAAPNKKLSTVLVVSVAPAGPSTLTSALAMSASVAELAFMISANKNPDDQERALNAAELLVHCANILEIVAAARAVRNRIAAQSEFPIALLMLGWAVSFALDSAYY